MSDPACAIIQSQIQQLQGQMPGLLLEQDGANGEEATAQANWFTAQAALNQAQYLLNRANERKLAADIAVQTAQSNLQMLQFQFNQLGCGN